MSVFSVGVDFGTSTTAAVLRWPDGTVRPLIIDGSELMPSAVCRDPSGVLLAGRDALHAGRSFPDGFEPNLKRCVDDGAVLLGGVEIPVVDLFAAVLRRVADEARRAAGGPLPTATITCPVGWGTARRRILLAAARAAGLAPVALAREPVAAATRFTRTGDPSRDRPRPAGRPAVPRRRPQREGDALPDRVDHGRRPVVRRHGTAGP